MSTPMLEEFLNTSEAAKEIGCCNSRVRQMLLAGEMQGKKVSERTWLIPRDEVLRVKANPPKIGRPRKNQGQ